MVDGRDGLLFRSKQVNRPCWQKFAGQVELCAGSRRQSAIGVLPCFAVGWILTPIMSVKVEVVVIVPVT